MRNFFKLLEAMQSIAIIVMVAVIGFSMAGCVFEDPNGGGGEDQKTLQNISVNGYVDGEEVGKRYYFTGEELELVVMAYYTDKSSGVLASSEYTLSAIDMSTRGQKSITVTYSGTNYIADDGISSAGTTIYVYPGSAEKSEFLGTYSINAGTGMNAINRRVTFTEDKISFTYYSGGTLVSPADWFTGVTWGEITMTRGLESFEASVRPTFEITFTGNAVGNSGLSDTVNTIVLGRGPSADGYVLRTSSGSFYSMERLP